MTTNQKITNANLAKWIAIFKEQADSGLTIDDWCSRNSISRHSFFYWKRKLKEKAADSFLPDIVSVPSDFLSPDSTNSYNLQNTMHSAVPAKSQKLYKLDNFCNNDCELSIRCGGIHLSFESSVPDSLILEMLKVVRHA